MFKIVLVPDVGLKLILLHLQLLAATPKIDLATPATQRIGY
jgi:hypothetical protein